MTPTTEFIKRVVKMCRIYFLNSRSLGDRYETQNDGFPRKDGEALAPDVSPLPNDEERPKEKILPTTRTEVKRS